MVEVFEIYEFDKKTMYYISDGKIIRKVVYEEHPMVLWNKKECCLEDMDNISFLSRKMAMTEDCFRNKFLL